MNRFIVILLIAVVGLLAATNVSAVAPQNVHATDGTYPTHVEITWDPVPGATGYQVYKSYTNNTDNLMLVGLAGPGQTIQFDLTNNISGTPFYYFVRATFNGAPHEWSQGNFGYANAQPNPPSQVYTFMYNNQVAIEWQPPAGGIWYYAVFRSINSTENPCNASNYFRRVFGIGPTGQQWTYDPLPQAGDTVQYAVRTVNPNGRSSCTLGPVITVG